MRLFHQFGNPVMRQAPGNDHSVQIQHSSSHRHRKGKTVRRIACPLREQFGGRFILFAVIEGMRIAMTRGARQRLKAGQRGLFDQLCGIAFHVEAGRQRAD